MMIEEKDSWKPGDFIHYAGAVIDHNEIDAILRVIYESRGRNWTVGAVGTEFEKKLAERAGCRRAILTNSGSSALLLAILALKLPKKSYIAIPATCFPTAFNAIVYAGHIPVVVDSDVRTFNINQQSLFQAFEEYKIGAVLIEMIAGNVVSGDLILKIQERYNRRTPVKVILDNCDGFGGRHLGSPVESLADVSTTSFHAAHIITTGEGGAVFTDDKQTAIRARRYRDWGREGGNDSPTKFPELPDDYPKRYTYTVPGFNLKMLELQAAMGLVQLGKLDRFMAERSDNFKFLIQCMDRVTLRSAYMVGGAKPCWLSFPIYCQGTSRSKFVSYLNGKGIESRPIFAGNITKQPYVKKLKYKVVGDLPEANMIMKNGLFITVSPRNSQQVYQYIVDSIKDFYVEA